MHRHPRVNTQRSPQVRRWQTLLVQPVPRLMDRTEKRIERLVRVITSGHAHVTARSRTKRMQRHIDPSTRIVKADTFRHVP